MYRDGYKVDILFLIEHRDRELDSICAIAKILKKEYGLSVAVASLLFHSLIAAMFVRPKVVVVPFAYSGREFPVSLFRAIYGDKITYVNMNLEQILSPVNKEYKKPRDEFAKSILKHFCWGRAFKDYLISNGVKEKNIYITGNPAITLLKKLAVQKRDSFKSFIAERLKLPRDYRWLFFPMNCGWAFMSDYHIRTRIKEGYNEQQAWAYKKYVNTTLDAIFRWISKAGQEIKDKKIIIILRPHPSVSVEQYKERFKKSVGYVPEYVYISKDLTAKEWVLASDVCYTNFSTVALDASLIGKPAYLMEPEPYLSFIEMDWYRKFPTLKSFSEFRDSLKEKQLIDEKTLKILDEFVDSNLDGPAEAAKYLAEFADRGRFISGSFGGLVKGIAANSRQSIGGFLRMLAVISGLNLFLILRPGIKPDFFRKKDVTERL